MRLYINLCLYGVNECNYYSDMSESGLRYIENSYVSSVVDFTEYSVVHPYRCTALRLSLSQ